MEVAAQEEVKDGAVLTAESVIWRMRVVKSVSGSDLVTADFYGEADDGASPGKGLPAPF